MPYTITYKSYSMQNWCKNTFYLQELHLLQIFFTNPIMHIHSQHLYLLGFDSNLVPNSLILVFQPYPEEDSEYSEKSGRFAHSSASSLGNTPNNRENR